jgi:hypothetical protein
LRIRGCGCSFVAYAADSVDDATRARYPAEIDAARRGPDDP